MYSNPSLKGELATVKGYEKPPNVRPYPIKISPNDSANVTVSTAQKQSKFRIPTNHRYGGDCRIKATLAAGGVVDATTGARNCIATLTLSAALDAGSFSIGFFNRETQIYSATPALAFNSSAAAIKAAIEALESFKTKEGTAMTVTVSAALSAGAATTFTISGAGAQVAFEVDQFVFNSQGSTTVVTSAVWTISTTASETHLESFLACFDRIRVTLGGQELMNLREAGKYMTMRYLSQASKEDYQSWGRLMGFGSINEKVRDNVSGRSYELPLDRFFDLFKHVLPTTSDLSSHPLEIEVYWAVSARCCVSTIASSVVSYALTDLELQLTALDEKGQAPKNQPSRIAYSEPYLDSDVISTSATSGKVKISRAMRSCNKVWAGLQYSANATNVALYDKNQTFIKSGITSYQFRLNGELYPQSPVDSDAESYDRFLRNSVDLKQHSGLLKDYQSYTSDTVPNYYQQRQDSRVPGPFHVICEDFRLPQVRHKDMHYRGGGVNLANQSDSTLEINKTADATGNIDVLMFVEHDTMLEIDGAKKVNILR